MAERVDFVINANKHVFTLGDNFFYEKEVESVKKIVVNQSSVCSFKLKVFHIKFQQIFFKIEDTK